MATVTDPNISHCRGPDPGRATFDGELVCPCLAGLPRHLAPLIQVHAACGALRWAAVTVIGIPTQFIHLEFGRGDRLERSNFHLATFKFRDRGREHVFICQ